MLLHGADRALYGLVGLLWFYSLTALAATAPPQPLSASMTAADIGSQLPGATDLQRQAWRDLQILSADQMEGRANGSIGSARAQQYLVDRFTELGLTPHQGDFRQPFRYKSSLFSQRAGVNIVGNLVGCRDQDQYIVVTAHYDHLPVKGRTIYNGADDNASGVAGLLYLAARLAQSCPAYSYVFMATDAEESGLYGAKAWLSAPSVPRQQMILNINLDMIGRGEKRQRLFLAGQRSLPQLRQLPLRQHGKVRLILGHDGRSMQGQGQGAVDWSNASDHAVFRRSGLPFLYFGVDVHPHYHTPKDDWQQISPAFFFSALSLIEQTVLLLESQTPAQLLQQ